MNKDLYFQSGNENFKYVSSMSVDTACDRKFDIGITNWKKMYYRWKYWTFCKSTNFELFNGIFFTDNENNSLLHDKFFLMSFYRVLGVYKSFTIKNKLHEYNTPYLYSNQILWSSNKIVWWRISQSLASIPNQFGGVPSPQWSAISLA